MSTTTTAAMYLRQSLDREGNELAISRQRTDCVKLCQERGWEWTEYVDNNISASNGKRRPDYQRMLDDIRGGKIGAVVVWDLDRLHRPPLELENFINLADEKQIALATVTGETDLSTDNGRLYARIKGAVARSEMERKSARQRSAAKQRAESGRVAFPCRPFGYTSKHANEIDKDEAKHLRAAYQAVLRGHSLMKIARDLNAKGVKTSRGGTWKATTLREVLLAARNAGLRSYNGEIVGKASVPAIVSRKTYENAVAFLTDPARVMTPKGGYGRKYLLTGLIACGVCGKPLGSSIHPSNHQPIYTCRHCGKCSRNGPRVDAYVTDLVVERLSRDDARELLIAHERADLAELIDKANTMRASKKRIAAMRAREEIDDDTFKAFIAEQNRLIEDVESKMHDTNKSAIFEGVIGADDVRAKFEALSLDRKRTIIDALLTVTVLSGQPPRGKLRLDLLPPTWKC